MAIVWPCPLSVDAYAAAGRTLEVPRPDCPDCGRAMIFWSGYLRPVRLPGRCVRLFIRRVRCRGCALTHALLPAFVLHKRLDAVEVIGAVLEAVARGEHGVRPAASAVDVPHATARGWWRRFSERANVHAVSFSALGVELGAPAMTAPGVWGALAAISAAFSAAASLPGWAATSRWHFCSAVSGGRLLAANTTSPYLVLGRRRFMPPVPFPNETGEQRGGP